MSDKPFKTFEEQIEILESRHLIINDHDYALNILSNVNYYFLTGYKKLLLEQNKIDEYKNGSTFEELYALYLLDKNIKMLTLNVLLQIEQKVKTTLAYEICNRYGNECTCYKNPNVFDLYNQNTLEMIKRVTKQIEDKKHKHNALKHYVDNHNGDIPLWVAVKVLTFGVIRRMYSSLKSHDKDYISRKMLCKPILKNQAKTVDTLLELIVDERNACAHDEMFMNFIHNKIKIPITQYHKYFSLYKNPNGEIVSGRKDFFSLIIAIKFFISDEDFKNYINSLKGIINEHMKDVRSYSEKELYAFIHLPIDFQNIANL